MDQLLSECLEERNVPHSAENVDRSLTSLLGPLCIGNSSVRTWIGLSFSCWSAMECSGSWSRPLAGSALTPLSRRAGEQATASLLEAGTELPEERKGVDQGVAATVTAIGGWDG